MSYSKTASFTDFENLLFSCRRPIHLLPSNPIAPLVFWKLFSPYFTFRADAFSFCQMLPSTRAHSFFASSPRYFALVMEETDSPTPQDASGFFPLRAEFNEPTSPNPPYVTVQPPQAATSMMNIGLSHAPTPTTAPQGNPQQQLRYFPAPSYSLTVYSILYTVSEGKPPSPYTKVYT